MRLLRNIETAAATTISATAAMATRIAVFGPPPTLIAGEGVVTGVMTGVDVAGALPNAFAHKYNEKTTFLF